MQSNKEIIFWAHPDQDIERLTHETLDEAVMDFLSLYSKDACPETVEIDGYARMIPALQTPDALEHVLEYLDEEYGDPDDSWTEPTEKMLKAEQEFFKVVLEEYEPYACEIVHSKIVNIREWNDRKKI